ncbi:MAG: ribokinase [Sedimentisphaerales bacterium]|nr:ribokinase [Sedimentisphaerales bacterium]
MTGRNPRVVVIGGTYVDMAVRCSQIPAAGQSVAGSALSYSITGPGPTKAAQAALCGCEVQLVSKVGGDPFASLVARSLAEYKVKTDLVCTAEAMNTGVVVTLVGRTGENASCFYAGANGALQEQDIDAAEQEISEADVCLVHGGLPHEAVVRAIRHAKVHGTTVILNPARPVESRCIGGQSAGELPMEYFSADILIPSLCEAAEIADQSGANMRTAKLIGSDLVARGVKYAVITMGRRGCMVVSRDGAEQIPAFDVEIVNQTGVGDAFAGALAASVAVGDEINEAVKFASAAGALACSKFGAIEALPTKAEIIQLLQSEDLPLGGQ